MEINRYGIIIGDVFYLNYCGINVFFRVCKTYTNSVCLYEIETKIKKIEGKTYTALCSGLPAKKQPLIINAEQNTLTKSRYEVYPIISPYEYEKKVVLPINISATTPIFAEALKHENAYPIIGYAYAYKIKEFRNVCWETLS